MAAPTPVRALVHSSTLVTAGVYLLIRFRRACHIFYFFNILFFLGILTTLIARTRALFEADLKKIIALSTLRQLGIIIRAVGLNIIKFAFLHIVIHAFFKALLFICAGKLIHLANNNQDRRVSGGFIENIPFTTLILNLANFALCGIPFLSGFYTKDLLVEAQLIQELYLGKLIIYIFLVGLSMSYSFRLSFLIIVKKNNSLVHTNREELD